MDSDQPRYPQGVGKDDDDGQGQCQTLAVRLCGMGTAAYRIPGADKGFGPIELLPGSPAMNYGLPDCIRFALSSVILTALLISHHWPEALALLLIWIACEIFTYHSRRKS